MSSFVFFKIQDLDTKLRRATANVEDYCEDLKEAVLKGTHVLPFIDAHLYYVITRSSFLALS